MSDGQILFSVELIGIFEPLSGDGLIAGIFHVVRGRIEQGKNTGSVDESKNYPVSPGRYRWLHIVASKHWRIIKARSFWSLLSCKFAVLMSGRTHETE
ncbi:hypothetical protein D3C85_1760460 [compost metagenome]